MKILVTGSTGFIGGAVCRALVAQGESVRAFHRASSNLRQIEDLPVEHAVGDLTQPDTIRAAVEGVEAVFHIAAWVGMNDPGRLYAITVEGTRAIIQAVRQVGVRRLVYTSSVAALGIPPAGIPSVLDERSTWNCAPELFPYGYAKYLAELEIQKGVAQGLDAVIVNPSMVLGPGDLYRQSSSAVMQIARRKVVGAADGGANAIHVEDVAAGHLAAMLRGRTGERYILGGKNISYIDLAQKIARAAGVPLPEVVLPGRVVRALRGPARLLERFLELPVPADTFELAGRYLYYDTRKARAELGLAEPRPVEQAIRETLDWFEGRGPVPAA